MMGVILELRLLHYSLSPTSASDHFRIWTNVNFKMALNVEEMLCWTHSFSFYTLWRKLVNAI